MIQSCLQKCKWSLAVDQHFLIIPFSSGKYSLTDAHSQNNIENYFKRQVDTGLKLKTTVWVHIPMKTWCWTMKLELYSIKKESTSTNSAGIIGCWHVKTADRHKSIIIHKTLVQMEKRNLAQGKCPVIYKDDTNK